MKIVVSEFIGTFILVLAILVNTNALYIAAAFLAAITIAASSGAHLNPVVSMVMWLNGKIATSSLPYYIVPQILGGLFAVLVSKHLT